MILLITYSVIREIIVISGNKLIRPTDSNGNICGIDEAVKNETVLLYFDILKCSSAADLATSNMQCQTYHMCRSSCPDEYYSYYTHTLPALTEWATVNVAIDNIGGNPITLGSWDCDVAEPPGLPVGRTFCFNTTEIICKPQVQAKERSGISYLIFR